jgi:rhodanese-related sulfurtransferase
MKKNPPKPTIIDVRNADEFEKGHAKNSINIPFQEMEERLDEVKKIKTPIICVCGGGTRNIKASTLLKSHGIEGEAGGSWKKVEEKYGL